MGKPAGTKNVTDEERERIRELYRQGMRLMDIVETVGRSQSVVYRTVCGMRRPRLPFRHYKNDKRNDRILRLIEEGRTHADVARTVGLSPRQIGYIVERHPRIAELLHHEGWKPSEVSELYRISIEKAQRIKRRRPSDN